MCHIPIEQLSPELRAIARKNQSVLLQRIADQGQSTVADAVAITETKMSRLKGTDDKQGDLELFAVLAAVLNIKLVDAGAIYCNPEMAKALTVILQHASASPEFVNILFGGAK